MHVVQLLVWIIKYRNSFIQIYVYMTWCLRMYLFNFVRPMLSLFDDVL